jgi:hypothetical protein
VGSTGGSHRAEGVEKTFFIKLARQSILSKSFVLVKTYLCGCKYLNSFVIPWIGESIV